MALSEAECVAYERDGFVIKRGFFSRTSLLPPPLPTSTSTFSSSFHHHNLLALSLAFTPF